MANNGSLGPTGATLGSRSHVRNPLTVISIFAGIAEISGTAVLPLIAVANQATFIWFLMLFPALLVVAFFLTLNLNHRCLYAPSDYQDERNFLFPLTPEQRDEKLDQEVVEAEPPGSRQESIGQLLSQREGEAARWQERRARYERAEKLGVEFVERLVGRKFQRELSLQLGKRPVFFDGALVDEGLITAVEVKLVRGSFGLIPGAFDRFLLESERISRELLPTGRRLSLHLVLMLEGDVPEVDVRRRMGALLAKYDIDCKLHVIKYVEPEIGK